MKVLKRKVRYSVTEGWTSGTKNVPRNLSDEHFITEIWLYYYIERVHIYTWLRVYIWLWSLVILGSVKVSWVLEYQEVEKFCLVTYNFDLDKSVPWGHFIKMCLHPEFFLTLVKTLADFSFLTHEKK